MDYLEMLAYGVEGLQVGRFPDPEPRRLHNAVNHDRVYFIEQIWMMKTGQVSRKRGKSDD